MAKILTIDDSLLTRNMMRRFLESNGHDVVEASDGKMGLMMLEKHNPECIVCDLLMPNMDGFQFLKEIKTINSTVPVIIFSANIQKKVAEECKKLGAFEFFYKPPKLDKSEEKDRFLEVLNQALGMQSTSSIEIRPEQIDILAELINIGMGRAASSLNDLLDSFIKLQIPRVWVFKIDDVPEELAKFGNDTLFIVRQDFKGPFAGKVALIFPPESAASLVSVLTGEDKGSSDLDSVRAGTLCEIGNILINGVLGSICNVLEHTVDFSLPNYIESNVKSLLDQVISRSEEKIILMAKTCFSVEALNIEGHFLLLLDTESFDKLLIAVNDLENREK